MKTISKTRTTSKGKKENPIELVESQVLNGQIITLPELTEENSFSLKAGIKAFYMALKR